MRHFPYKVTFLDTTIDIEHASINTDNDAHISVARSLFRYPRLSLRYSFPKREEDSFVGGRVEREEAAFEPGYSEPASAS